MFADPGNKIALGRSYSTKLYQKYEIIYINEWLIQ